MRVGALDAQNDALLEQAFYDAGHIDRLVRTDGPEFLLIGRTGSGKSALLHMVQDGTRPCSVLDPESLALQYLHNAPILQALTQWNINLEIFYKYLWRHICVLEIIRLRYGADLDSAPSIYHRIFRRKEVAAQEHSKQYLFEHDGHFWIETDQFVRKIVSEVEQQLGKEFGGEFKTKLLSMSGKVHSEKTVKTQLEAEETQRVQQVISRALLEDLQRVVGELQAHGFSDRQRQYYILIDDLDTNWMPDDDLYLQLLKSLIFTVRDINHQLPRVKIIVALRENIFFRVFAKAEKHEPQREKWHDSIINVQWSNDELALMMSKRVSLLLQEQYTTKAPDLLDILPTKHKHKGDALAFILKHTFERPRDLIHFFNTCLDRVNNRERIDWPTLTAVQRSFSKQRLDWLYDEWRDSYFGLEVLFGLVRQLGPRFSWPDLSEDRLLEVVSAPMARQCNWLSSVADSYVRGDLTTDDVRAAFLHALFVTGVVGIKENSELPVHYTYNEEGRTPTSEMLRTGDLHVHPALHVAFGFATKDA